LLGNSLSNRFAPYFLFSRKDLIKYLPSLLIPIIDAAKMRERKTWTQSEFCTWQRYCTALQQQASAKLCSFEQSVPPVFGRATITLGIGPHSS